VSVDVTVKFYKYLDQAKRKDENLAHEQRRHWDGREFDEYIIARESKCYSETPEQWLCRKETLQEIIVALESCTEVQRQRFLLFALDGMNYAEIGKFCGCCKYALRDSIEAVRKNLEIFLRTGPTKWDFRANQMKGILPCHMSKRDRQCYAALSLLQSGGLAYSDHQSQKVLLPLLH
jgi:RNA polymerase sigma-70 factor (ECF subfamily)